MNDKVSILPGMALDRLRQALEEEEKRDIAPDCGVEDKWATVKELGAVLTYLDEVKMEPEATRLLRLWGALGDACVGRKHSLLTPVPKKRERGRRGEKTQNDREREIRATAALAMELFMKADMPHDRASEEVGRSMTEAGRKTEKATVRNWRDKLGHAYDPNGAEQLRVMLTRYRPLAMTAIRKLMERGHYRAAANSVVRDLKLLVRIS